jgi:Flp pilus assembly protein TadD
MVNRFLNPSLILILALVVAGCAERNPYGLGSPNAYGDYLTAVYARGTGDDERASRAYLDLLDKEPDNPALLEGAYSFFVFNGDLEHALPVAERLNAIDPDHVPTGMVLALDAFRARDFERMEARLSRVKGFGFDNLMAPIMRGWALALQGRGDDALQALGALLKNKKFEPFYVEHRALILDYLGRTAEAEAAYRAIAARDPLTSVQPVLALAALLGRKGENEEAERVLTDLAGKNPGDPDIETALAALRAGERLKSPAALPNQALASSFLRVGTELGRDRAFLPAVVYARFALYLDPGLDQARLYLANLFLNQSFPELALSELSAMAPESPLAEDAALRKVQALSALDRFDEAVAAAEALAAREPTDFEALVALGDLYRGHEQYAQALPYYQRASALRGELGEDDWFLLFVRGICFERLGRWDEAEADLKQALAYRPENPDILNYLGYSWIDRGINLADGRALLEKAVGLAPDDGFILDSLGWAQYRLGEYGEAVDTLEKAVAMEPGDPVLNDHLGDAYWKAGREREAGFQWNRALVFNPTDADREEIEAKLAFGLPETNGRGE